VGVGEKAVYLCLANGTPHCMSAQRCFSAFASRRGRADQHKTSVSPTSRQLIGQIGVTWRHGAERSRRCQFILREYHISSPSSLPWIVRSVAHVGYSSGFGVEPESMLMGTAVPQARTFNHFNSVGGAR